MEKVIRIISHVMILSFTIILFGGCVEDKISSELSLEVSDYTDYPTGLTGLSGLSLAPDGNCLYAVCDNGNLYKIDFEGKVIETVYKGNNDFEAVDVQPGTNMIFLGDEGEMAVWKLDQGSLVKITDVVVENAVTNKGIEGVACDGNNCIYIANQESPTEIMKYDLKSNMFINTYPIAFAKFLSDLCFDTLDNTLWIVDSKAQKIYHCDSKCNLNETFSIPFVAKAEAIVVDHTNNVIWLGCDQTSLLYKVKIDSLKNN